MANQAVIYARFSPRKNAAECLSIETQVAKARQYAALYDYTVGEVYTDEAISGKAMDRPGLLAALDYCCKHKATLIAYSLSRLARNARGALEIMERLLDAGGSMVMLKEQMDLGTTTGRMVFTILAAVAEAEREMIAERTSDAMLHHQAQGRLMGARAPIGWMRGPDETLTLPDGTTRRRSTLIECKAEQDMMMRIRSMYQDEELEVYQIANELNRQGLQFRGHPWRKNNVHAALVSLGAKEQWRCRLPRHARRGRPCKVKDTEPQRQDETSAKPDVA